MIAWILLAAVAAMLAYIRLAPSDVDRWHRPIEARESKTFEGGAIRVIDARPDTLTRVNEAATDLPRTQVLAGSVAEGRVTYVTRSRLMGFPDYTTVEQQGDTVKLYARLRFGRSDMGVNAARLERLVKAAQP